MHLDSRRPLPAAMLTILLALSPALPLHAQAADNADAANVTNATNGANGANGENGIAAAISDDAARLRAAMAADKAAAAASAEPAVARPVGAADSPFYQELGGQAGIGAIVDEFVAIMLKDARVAATFDGVDMDRLHAKLAEQFCVAAGGPCRYTGKSMAEVHEDMQVNHAQFNASVEDLQLAMERRGVPSRVQNRLLARLAPTRRAIVTR